MSSKTWYCPVCGMDNQPYDNNICDWCGNEIQMVESIHDWRWYTEKAQQVYNKEYLFELTEEEEHSILLEEAKNNPLFNEDVAKKAFQKWKTGATEAAERYFKRKDAEKALANKPKCPTCGSTNIQKISATSKVVGASMFGLFSKTARSQFKCKNCGYKW